jgi:hypothetical protein
VKVLLYNFKIGAQGEFLSLKGLEKHRQKSRSFLWFFKIIQFLRLSVGLALHTTQK